MTEKEIAPRGGLMTADPATLPAGQAAAGAKAAKGPSASPASPRTARRTRKLFGLALLALVFVLGVALGTLLLGGLVLHALVPDRVIDIFAALHNHIVLGVLLGLAVLWLSPPYPWAPPQPSVETQGQTRSAGDAERRGTRNAPVASQRRSRSRLTGRPQSEAPME